MKRAAGILLHPTSLPGRFGIGDLGTAAVTFLDWAAAAGQSVWQVLPLHPPALENCPYTALSSYAGNPLLLSPARLVEDELLPAAALASAPPFPEERVDFPAVAAWKADLLRASFAVFRQRPPAAVRQAAEAFRDDPAVRAWLDDWALFAALRERFGNRPWNRWEEALRWREPAALAAARRDLADEIEFHRYLQFLFFRQWDAVRREAQRRGVTILGDLPIYVALDSADVWTRPELFALDRRGDPTAVAGVPPDYFSATGQRWGNPIYRWDRHAEEGFAWWVARLRWALRLAGMVRIDHFRGFAAYWEIPAEEPTAVHGRWVEGPGDTFFAAVRRALGELPIVAEDLGVITPDVEALRQRWGLPGMKVLQFAFSEPDSPHLPHRFTRDTVVYTGTHDNDTTCGWYQRASAAERERLATYAGSTGRAVAWDLIRLAATSVADLAIVPLQDVAGLGSEARMNTPGVAAGNWAWRASPQHLCRESAGRLRALAEVSGRFPPGELEPGR